MNIGRAAADQAGARPERVPTSTVTEVQESEFLEGSQPY